MPIIFQAFFKVLEFQQGTIQTKPLLIHASESRGGKRKINTNK